MVNETVQVRIMTLYFIFFFFFCMYVWKCDKRFAHFLQIVAEGPSAFPK